MKKTAALVTLGLLVTSTLAPVGLVNADTQGVDWSVYQGNNGVYGYPSDKFVISQVGGAYGTQFVNQKTYASQVSGAIANGKRAHTYIWFQIGKSMYQADNALDHFLPMVKTPKGSIVALDYEAGASNDKYGNTEVLLHSMRRIKKAGYTPVLYSGEYFLNQYVDYKRIVAEFGNCLWIARYPYNGVTKTPPAKYKPTISGLAIWQFTSNYKQGSLDGNVDYTGITNSGYSSNTSSKPSQGTSIDGDDAPNLTPNPQPVQKIDFYQYAPSQVKVISGAFTYTSTNMTSENQVKYIKPGTVLNVKSFVKINDLTRFKLNDGTYFSGSKQYSIPFELNDVDKTKFYTGLPDLIQVTSGAHIYKSSNMDTMKDAIKYVIPGTVLKIKDIVTVGDKSRYVLEDGTYFSGYRDYSVPYLGSKIDENFYNATSTKIKIISGAYTYDSENMDTLDNITGYLEPGTILNVQEIVVEGNKTRFLLDNGDYVSAHKQYSVLL